MAALSRRIAIAAAGAAGFTRHAHAQQADGPAKVMERYAAALRSNNLEGLVSLFSDNGVYTRPDFPPAVGHQALRAAFRHVFETLRVDIQFDIQEVEVLGDLAWLRSGSTGKVKELKTGVESKDAY